MPQSVNYVSGILCKRCVRYGPQLSGRRARTVETDCVNNGKFLVMEELRDRTHNIPTGLRIHLSYSYKDQLSAQGEALVVKNFNTDNEGQLSNTWEVRSLKLANLSDIGRAS